MTDFQEDFILSRELQLLTDEYHSAPVQIKNWILQDILLLQAAITLLNGDAS